LSEVDFLSEVVAGAEMDVWSAIDGETVALSPD
jgi:hypothetical protein